MSTTSHEGLTAVASSMLALSTVSIALRFYSRRVQKAPLKTDDWIMIPCLLLLGGTCGTALYGTNKKILGYPTPSDKSLALETAPIASKLYFAFDLFSILTLGGFGACIARLAVFVELDNLPATKKVDSRLTNTKSIYLSILEVGLSCVAVNLPTLYYLSHKVTPENVLRSVRSIISLRSIGSQNSKGYQKSKSSKDNQSVESPSLSNLRPDDVMAIETHAMYDLESTGQVSVPNDVHVTKTLSQSSQRL
ncbi:hypothetical protein BOTNAR_0037g00380 [Botryotinia narcissicola]|uniref:Uncharacterized protein n=1 Tax=Botryotinia narcissicola TaxID=278944 RepID=A0A4Z1J295_9HELO|nr:hypothetical protein BOTNAR_0037g00380 [Botryotinia narcissicola]